MVTFQPTKNPMSELASRTLCCHSYRALKNISCECKNDVLILRGCLPTFYLKQMAQEAVVHLEGIEGIDNQIEVG